MTYDNIYVNIHRKLTTSFVAPSCQHTAAATASMADQLAHIRVSRLHSEWVGHKGNKRSLWAQLNSVNPNLIRSFPNLHLLQTPYENHMSTPRFSHRLFRISDQNTSKNHFSRTQFLVWLVSFGGWCVSLRTPCEWSVSYVTPCSVNEQHRSATTTSAGTTAATTTNTTPPHPGSQQGYQDKRVYCNLTAKESWVRSPLDDFIDNWQAFSSGQGLDQWSTWEKLPLCEWERKSRYPGDLWNPSFWEFFFFLPWNKHFRTYFSSYIFFDKKKYIRP